MKDILLQHIAAHPSITAQDIIKLCYQAVFGAEHLLLEQARAWDYFRREWEMTPAMNRCLTEPLSDSYCRVDIASWKHLGLPPEWLFRMFYATASCRVVGTAQDLTSLFGEVEVLARERQLPFTSDSWSSVLKEYEQLGGGAVHHSNAYRTAEQPAYRVVRRSFAELIPLLIRLAALPATPGEPKIIAIEGRAASGKSTLAENLSVVLAADIIHMDDFFLPPSLRTEDRLTEAGGNIHYERFVEQVLPHIKDNGAFHYDVFDCQIMKSERKQAIRSTEWRIVEGVYSHHPRFADYMDLRIFCDITPQEQMRRIRLRNGEALAQRFETAWIPMEERYFSAFPIEALADYKITN